MTNDSVEVHAVYAGQREARGGKIAQAWQVDGEVLWFSKPSGGVIGGIYILEMTPDHTRVYTGSTRYTMERIEDQDLIASWTIAHKTVIRNRKRIATERRHKANDILKDATWSLDRIVRGLRNVDEVYALNTILQEHLLAEYWRSRK